MGIGAVGSSPSSPSGSPTSSAQGTSQGGQLGENTFLQLLVAQLKYQDPMQPVDNTQFVTQLAQFQMLSVLNDIKSDMDKLVAAAGGAAPATGGAAAAGGAASTRNTGMTGSTGTAGGG